MHYLSMRAMGNEESKAADLQEQRLFLEAGRECHRSNAKINGCLFAAIAADQGVINYLSSDKSNIPSMAAIVPSLSSCVGKMQDKAT